MISERSNPTVILIGEILNVVQKTTTGVEPGDVANPAWLGFVAVAEVDVCVVAGYYTSINRLAVGSSFVCGKGAREGIPPSSDNSFNPKMIYPFGAFSQVPVGTRVAPTASNSSSR